MNLSRLIVRILRQIYRFLRLDQLKCEGWMLSPESKDKLKSKSHMFVKLFIFFFGLLLGAYINHYGYLLNDIRVDMPIETCRQRFEVSATFNIKGCDDYMIPNIVHYIWFGQNKTMTFVQFLSILSAYKVQQPDSIYLHCNNLPIGYWWTELRKQVPIIKILPREPPETIFGQRLMHTYHKGDVAKLQVLMQYGGIYLDYDIIVLKNLNALRKYEITLGQEIKTDKLNAGFIAAHKDALFLRLSYDAYKDQYQPVIWDYNCASVPFAIYKKHPGLVHVEPSRLTSPGWNARHLIWKGLIDWSDFYVMHLMMHFNWDEFDPDSIRTLNTTFGQITRYIYYGSKKLLK